ncbi:MAG: outer membrane lipoprotein-sorting protein [Acidobacteriota bacterium]
MRKSLYQFLPIFLFLGLIYSIFSSESVYSQEKVDLEKIIQMSIDAQGGKEILDKVNESYIVAGIKVFTPQGEFLGERKIYMRSEPMRIRIEQTIMGVETVIGYDGEKAWFQQMGQAIEAPKFIFDSFKASEKRENLLMRYKEKECKLEYLGVSNIEGRDCHGIKFIDKQGEETNIFFDKETFLPVKTEYSARNESGQIVKTENISFDFKEVEGMKIQFRSVAYADGKKIMETTIKEIKLNPGFDDKIFSMPEKK